MQQLLPLETCPSNVSCNHWYHLESHHKNGYARTDTIWNLTIKLSCKFMVSQLQVTSKSWQWRMVCMIFEIKKILTLLVELHIFIKVLMQQLVISWNWSSNDHARYLWKANIKKELVQYFGHLYVEHDLMQFFCKVWLQK